MTLINVFGSTWVRAESVESVRARYATVVVVAAGREYVLSLECRQDAVDAANAIGARVAEATKR